MSTKERTSRTVLATLAVTSKQRAAGSNPARRAHQSPCSTGTSAECGVADHEWSLSPPGYPGDHPCPTKGAAIQSHNDEDQSTLQRGTLGVRQERYGEAELHRVGPSRKGREGDIQLSGSKAAGEISGPLCPRYQLPGGQQADGCHCEA